MIRGLAIAAILIATLLIGACAGYDWESPFSIVRAVSAHASIHDRLIVDWRLPRVLASASVGLLLGLSGAIFQGVFRNPLAEPYLLGSAGGAALGATVALLVPLGVPSPCRCLSSPSLAPGRRPWLFSASLDLPDRATSPRCFWQASRSPRF